MMKNYFFAFLLAFFLIPSGIVKSQYVVQSPWLQNPDLLIGYVEDCADFWMPVEDDVYGGFFTDVGKSGNILNFNQKGIVPLSRDAYGFVRAFMMTGNEEYLEYARSALDFMYEHLWDDNYGGWYKTCNRNGSSPYTGNKTAFDQHYALLGITACYEATGDTADLAMLMKGYEFNEQFLWDPDPLEFGYYDQVIPSGFIGFDKSFNATVDAITTHVYNLYLITGQQKYLDRLLELQENIIDRLVSNMDSQAIGFAEKYHTDWTIDESETQTLMGHVLKTGWCLGRIHRASPDEEAVLAAVKLVEDVLENGYDHVYGGPYKDYNRVTGELYMYGAIDTAKAWWQMEQAITSGFMLYDILGHDKYLKMADESLDFFMNHFVDPVYGEVYADRARDGGRVQYPGGFWDENKGNLYKAAYHSIETGYYSYLYGKLLVKGQPAVLYYRYEPMNETRTVNLTPLAIDFSRLRVSSVTKDGETYSQFDPANRILEIPSGVGGLFEVTYELAGSNDIADSPVPGLVDLRLYPNPASQYLNIDLVLNSRSNMTLNVISGAGMPVHSFDYTGLTEGRNHLRIECQGWPPGIYFITLIFDRGTATARAIIR